MIEYSSILLIILIFGLVIIVIKRVSISSFTGFKNKLSLEHFGNKRQNGLFDSKLFIKKTNKYKLVFSNNKYHIWAPESIDNYHPVMHYISKKKKPTEFAILVNNHDHNTVKPDSYNIISITNNNFGIWKPVSSNPEYSTLGNVYSKEYPSKYLVRMIHNKFLIETDVKKMIVDNVSIKNDKGYELWSIQESPGFVCNNRNNSQEFDSLKNIKALNKNLVDVKKKLYIKYTLSYKRVFKYKDTKLGKDFGVWRPIPPKNFYSLGDIIVKSNIDPNNTIETIVVHKSFCKFPINYGSKPVISIKNNSTYSIWKPVAPDNYYFLGQVASRGMDEPNSEHLIACIPVDYLEKTDKNTNSLIWNNINEKKPQSLWVNSLNLLSSNNKYVPPESDGVILVRNFTSSDIDLMDNSKSIAFNFKKNPNYHQEMNEHYIKNMITNNLAHKFDIVEDRIKIDKLDLKTRILVVTITSRKVNKNSITVNDLVKTIENTLKIGDIRIYNEDKSNFIIKLDNAGLINENMNEITLDNTDYIMSF